MTTSVRTAVEDAVIDLLEDLRSPSGVKVVKPYAGEMGTGKPEDITRALNGVSPGILVATERGQFQGISVARNRYRREIEISLYIVTSGQRSREARQRGDNQIYEIVDSVLSRLIGVKPDLGLDDDAVAVGHLEPVSEDVLLHDPVLLVWKQTWAITVECQLAEPPAPDVTEVVGSMAPPLVDGGDLGPVVGASTLIT